MILPEHIKHNCDYDDCPSADKCEFDCPRCAVDKVIDLIKPYLSHCIYCEYPIDPCSCGLIKLLKELEG